jgi:nucleoid-associated protein YgaU
MKQINGVLSMKQINGVLRGSLTPLVLGLCIWLVMPAEALAKALVRFVHGVPGAGLATVEVRFGSGQTKLGTVSFGQSTAWRSIRSGSFHWTLIGSRGSTLAQGSATIGSGPYDIVALAETKGVVLGVYKAQAGKAGTSLVRVIHAAPELGSPQLELDSKVVDQSLSFTHATPYLSVNPGVHSLSAMRPGDSTPLLSVKGVKLKPDVAYSAIVLGSRGQMVRVVTVVDRGAPLTRPSAKHQVLAASPTGWVTVQSGDSLWRIASRVVGADASNAQVERELVAIWNANAARIGTGDPNLIFPGQRIHVPQTQA